MSTDSESHELRRHQLLGAEFLLSLAVEARRSGWPAVAFQAASSTNTDRGSARDTRPAPSWIEISIDIPASYH